MTLDLDVPWELPTSKLAELLDSPASNQRPRIETAPLFITTAADDAVDLALATGLVLDEWQDYVLRASLGEKVGGKWSAFEIGLILPRQNGKNAILEARELAGLFLFKEELIIHSAHEFKTSQEAFLKTKNRILNTPNLVDEIKGYDGDPEGKIWGIKTAHGSEGITLKKSKSRINAEGQQYEARLRFAARTGGSGRGFTGDLIVFDEAYALKQKEMAAMLPTMAAKSITGNPQLWYTSSAGQVDSDVLENLRNRAKGLGSRGESKRLAYFEWSVPHWDELPEEIQDKIFMGEEDLYYDDPRVHEISNPGWEIRISEEFIMDEREAMDNEEFGRERLGIWAKVGGESVLPYWGKAADKASLPGPLKAFAIDVSPARDYVAISSASFREDGKVHLELIKEFASINGVVEYMSNAVKKHQPVGVYAVQGSAAATLEDALKRKGVKLTLIPFKKYAEGVGLLIDALDKEEDQVRHIDQAELNAAVEAARLKDYGDTLSYWNRKKADLNISPLVSVTVAFTGLQGKALRRLNGGTSTGKVVIL